ncbi:MAG: DUF5060 domain-containing protein, partial [Anaerolineae bacterium]|nr:DUF5060 domain-containing protein [Anaerolineae bacterium]
MPYHAYRHACSARPNRHAIRLGIVLMLALLLVTTSLLTSGGVDSAYAAPPAQETPIIRVAPNALHPGYYEETYPDFIFNGNWTFKQKPAASGGGAAKAKVGASVSFSFNGQVLIIYRRTDPNDGPMQVCVDGSCEVVSNTSPQREWQVPVSFGPFSNTEHEVTIARVAGPFYFDAVEVVDLGAPLPVAGMYEENHVDLTYIGNWRFKVKAVASGGSVAKARDEDAALYFRFEGDELTLYRTIGPGFGDMRICVAQTCYTISNENPVRQWQQPVTLTGFGSGTHRAKISREGPGRLFVDALVTQGYVPPAPTATSTNPPPPTATNPPPATATHTQPPTNTPTRTPTNTQPPANTNTPTYTPSATNTQPPANTNTPTHTFTPTWTNTPPPTATSQPTQTVALYDTLEITFWSANVPGNPYDTYLLRLQITDPSGHSFTIDGFYDGDGSGGQSGNWWRARITPYMTGLWSWQTVPGDGGVMDSGLANLSGQFEAVASSRQGGVVRDGQYFRYQNGEPVFLLGNFLDFTNDMPSTHVYMSHDISSGQRSQVLDRQVNFHTANKINVYFANRGDYGGLAVNPWTGSDSNPDFSTMNLARWQQFDQYIRSFRDNGLVAEMWFFADDSNFGSVSSSDRARLLRYAMARTSAYSHTMYVIALEWQEGFSWGAINDMGVLLDSRNPWDRLISVHMLSGSSWEFGGQSWPGFIASQAGNDANPNEVNSYTIGFHNNESLPHIGEEFGILRSDSDTRLRGNLWATFLGGAAGSGTGSDLRAFRRFLEQSGVPFYVMDPANNLVEDGGNSRFVLAQQGHHYVVYS